MMRYSYYTLFAIIGLISCTPKIETPEPSSGTADFSRFVAVGGSYMAGYQDGALRDDHQTKSIPMLLGRQFSMITEKTYNQYTLGTSEGIGWNYKSWESWYVGASRLGDRTDCQGVVSMGPVKDSMSVAAAWSIFTNNYPSENINWSIPFASLQEQFNPALGNAPANNTNPYYHRIASNPGTSDVIEDASAMNASFFAAWFGMEEIYNYARYGGERNTPPTSAQFSAALDAAIIELTANGAKGVLATIPGLRSFPFYTLIPWNGANLTQSKADSLNTIYTNSGLSHIQFQEGANGFVINDPAAPMGVRQLTAGEFLTLQAPLDSMKCNFMGILFSVIPDQYVLDATEVQLIDQYIDAYNAVIRQKAAQYNLALVDMHDYFLRVNAGVVWDGVDYNATFVSGGFFSLDGFHPHEKGYALITNEFITAINIKYGATIPILNCFDCNGVWFP